MSSVDKLLVFHFRKFKQIHPRKHDVCARSNILFQGFQRDVCANGCCLLPRKVLSRVGPLSSKSATPHGFKPYHYSDSNDKFVRDLNDWSPPVPNDYVCDFRVETSPRENPVKFGPDPVVSICDIFSVMCSWWVRQIMCSWWVRQITMWLDLEYIFGSHFFGSHAKIFWWVTPK